MSTTGDYASLILACLGLQRATEIRNDVTEDNSVLSDSIRKANEPHLLGGSDLSAEVRQWLSVAKSLGPDDLTKIDASLSMGTYLAGNNFTVADVAVFVGIRSKYSSSVCKHHNLARWFDQIQHAHCRSGVFEPVDLKLSASAPLFTFTSAPGAAKGPEKSPDASGKPVSAAPGSADVGKKDDKKEKKETAPTDDKKGGDKSKGKGKGGGEGDKPSAPASAETEDGDSADPSKLDIRVGLVVKCWNHPESDKLLCEEIDLGEGAVRTIASGIRPHYTAEQLQGKRVCVLANLKDRSLAGFKSQGMVLCAVSKDHSAIKIVEPPAESVPGERIKFPGFDGEPASASQVAKKKILEKLAPQVRCVCSFVCVFTCMCVLLLLIMI
jgi:aminoacyl tRNA synthase complex-interacting multifunctional protein 1